MIDTTPHIITSLLAMGMALAFIVADRSSPTSRALALFLASVGVSLGVGTQIAYPRHYHGVIAAWDGVFAIPEALAFIFAYEWILRGAAHGARARNLKTRGPARAASRRAGAGRVLPGDGVRVSAPARGEFPQRRIP